jgi:hypothetical protein
MSSRIIGVGKIRRPRLAALVARIKERRSDYKALGGKEKWEGRKKKRKVKENFRLKIGKFDTFKHVSLDQNCVSMFPT